MKTPIHIDDLLALGEELTEEQLRLATGSATTRSGVQVAPRPTGPDGHMDGCTDPLDPYDPFTGPVVSTYNPF
jgi:hypothetical protein